MEMCSVAGVNLQRGMNFRLREEESTILMSVRPGAPYADRVEDEGRVLVYEGHDVAKTVNGPPVERVSIRPVACTACTSVLNSPAAIAVCTIFRVIC